MNLFLVTQKVNKQDPILGFFHDWIETLAQHVEHVTVACLEEGEHDLPENVTVVSLGKDKGHSRLRVLYNFFKCILTVSYDRVFVHMNPEYVVVAGWLWRLLGKRIALWYTHKSVDLKLRIAERFAHVIFSASRESFRLHTDKLQVMGHGIPVEKFNQHTHQDEKLCMVTIGRISPTKDYETMIHAVDVVRETIPNFTVDVFGGALSEQDEKYFDRLKKMVQEKGLEHQVVFKGPVSHDEIVHTLSHYDMFLHMSNTGSLDKVVLESMAAGVLVVSSNDASWEILEAYPEFLYTPGDVKEFADRIVDLAHTPKGVRQQKGDQLRQIVVDDHSLDSLITRIIQKLS